MKEKQPITNDAAIVYEPRLCAVTVQTAGNSLGTFSYHVCGRKAKFSVTHKDSCNGKMISRDLCGSHYKALEKNTERLMRKYNYDSELVSVPL